jgi:putative ABC transport system permease protein
MLRNYIKIALRHLRKNRGFSMLNVLGLSLGLACAVLILLWIRDEVDYNKFNKKYDRLFQVLENHDYNGKIYTFAATPGRLAAALKAELPEVRNAARMDWGERWLFHLKNKPLYENGHYVDPDFLRMFSFDVIQGDRDEPLPDEHSIVLTQKMAEKFFGEENPVGKFMKVNDEKELRVSAVIKDPPLSSTIQFSWLAHFSLFEAQHDWWQQWNTNGLQTYVELVPGTSPESFNAKFKSYIKNKDDESSAVPFLVAMKDWRLRNNYVDGRQAGGRIEYVKLFGIIAGILVVIACINFMNLATARSEQRAREVGVRKVMGALRKNLMFQFIGESVVMAFISMALAIVLVLASLPAFNELVGKKLEIDFSDGIQWLVVAGIALLSGILAGSYPSVFLSSFKPVSIFRGLRKDKNSGVVLVRKGLVITQFATSIVLIISTVVVYKQIDHVKNRQLGFNKERLIYLAQNGTINEKQEVIRQDLLNTGMVTHAASCSQRLLQLGTNTGGFNWQGKDESKDILITVENVSPDYLNTAGIKLLAGRDFNQVAASDSLNIIVNQTLAKVLGAAQPLNMKITRDSTTYTVVGVVNDFVYNDMYKKPDPVIFFCDPGNTNNYFIRIGETADLEKALAAIGDVFKKDNPGYPFEYNFVDIDFDREFRAEMLVSKLSRLFATITIVVSCLGLFGLAAYTAERRTKEIGIRKVLGASVQNLVTLLSRDFVKLVLIAILVATPLAWYIMHSWLQDYDYRIRIQPWVFVAAGSGAVFIALMTVSFQAIKAAVTNPVKSLRTE